MYKKVYAAYWLRYVSSENYLLETLIAIGLSEPFLRAGVQQIADNSVGIRLYRL